MSERAFLYVSCKPSFKHISININTCAVTSSLSHCLVNRIRSIYNVSYVLNPFLLYLYGVEEGFLGGGIILQTVGLLGRVISSSQGLYLNINTE
jgi:hypothetical protein